MSEEPILLNANGSLNKILPSSFPEITELRFAELGKGNFLFTWYDEADKEFYVQLFSKKFKAKGSESKASSSIKVWDTDIAKLTSDGGAFQVLLQKTGKLYIAYVDESGNVNTQTSFIAKIDRRATNLRAISVPGSRDILVTWVKNKTIYGLRFPEPQD